MNRIHILQEIDRIENEHCANCTLGGKNGQYQKSLYCIRKCDIGKQIQEVGSQLLQPTETERKKWQWIAKQNGITRDAFNSRVQRGFSFEEAATKPMSKAGRKKRKQA